MCPSVTMELGGNSPSGNIYPIIIYFNQGENIQVSTNAYLYPQDGGIRIRSNDSTSNGPTGVGAGSGPRGVAVQDVVGTGRAAAPHAEWAAGKGPVPLPPPPSRLCWPQGWLAHLPKCRRRTRQVGLVSGWVRAIPAHLVKAFPFLLPHPPLL